MIMEDNLKISNLVSSNRVKTDFVACKKCASNNSINSWHCLQYGTGGFKCSDCEYSTGTLENLFIAMQEWNEGRIPDTIFKIDFNDLTFQRITKEQYMEQASPVMESLDSSILNEIDFLKNTCNTLNKFDNKTVNRILNYLKDFYGSGS